MHLHNQLYTDYILSGKTEFQFNQLILNNQELINAISGFLAENMQMNTDIMLPIIINTMADY